MSTRTVRPEKLRTHCKHGHSYVEGNLVFVKRSYGRCRQCYTCLLASWTRQRNKNTDTKRSNKSFHLWRQRNKEKVIAHGIVQRAIRNGILIKPKLCRICGFNPKNIQAHHPDHSKPLEVLWLCQACHSKIHRRKNVSHTER